MFYNGRRPALTVNDVLHSGNTTIVKLDPAALGALPGVPAVFAARLDSGSRSSAFCGTLDAARGDAVFKTVLKAGDKIFFLEPGTYVPMEKPIVLQ